MAEETWPSEVKNALQTDLDNSDDTLFSMYLQSRSPSSFEGDNEKGTLVYSEAQSSIALQNTIKAKTDSVNSMEHVTATSSDFPPKAKRPRIIPRVHPEPKTDSTIPQQQKPSQLKSKSKQSTKPRVKQWKSKSQGKITIKLRIGSKA
jgi:hypothetical protein